jgi:RNA polymerase sigma-70 factor (ECF subfamily)
MRIPDLETTMVLERDNESGPSSVVDFVELAELFQQHRSRLLAMLQRRLDPKLAVRIDAEGLLTDAFVAARRKWPRFTASGMSSYAWLYGIARDCLIEAWRRENRQGRTSDREMPWPDRSSEQMAMGLMGSLTSPSEAMARGELQERVQQALDGLNASHREILWMRHFDDLPYREIALVLGISEDAAMQRYSRALKQVKDLWKNHFGRGESQP